MLFPPLPNTSDHPDFLWAFTGTRSGMAGRVLHKLAATQNGMLGCGVRSKELTTIASRVNPNGLHRFTLLKNWSAFGFADGTIILAHQGPHQLTCYPWVLRYKARMRTKPSGIERGLDAITQSLTPLSGPFGLTVDSDHPVLPWITMDVPVQDTFPHTALKAMVLTSLTSHPMAPKKLGSLRLVFKGRLLMADHPKLCGPVGVDLIGTLDEDFDKIAWADSVRAYLDADPLWPRLAQVGQKHEPHTFSGANWRTEPLALFDVDMHEHSLDQLSAHEKIEGKRLCQDYGLPLFS